MLCYRKIIAKTGRSVKLRDKYDVIPEVLYNRKASDAENSEKQPLLYHMIQVIMMDKKKGGSTMGERLTV